MPSKKLVSLIIGDAFLAEEKVKEIIQKIESGKKGSLHQVKLRLSETPIDQVLSDARTLPFLSDAQVFYLRDAQAIKDKQLETLENYFNDPSETSYLIFETDSIDRRGALYKLLSKHAEVHLLEDSQKKNEATKFINEKLRNSGKTIASNAIARLRDQAGDMPVVLESILSQLILYAGDQKQITFEMVEKFEEEWQEIDVFELVNAIASKDQARSVFILKQLLEDAPDLFSLLGILHWQIRRLWLARVLLTEGHSESDVLRRCRISPRQAPYFMRQLKVFSRKKLEIAIEGLFELDWKAKTGQAEGLVEIEKWIVQVTS